MLSMVGATLPAAPSVRKQKSIAFSMLFGRTIVTLAVLPRVEGSLRSVRSLRTGESGGRSLESNGRKTEEAEGQVGPIRQIGQIGRKES